MRRAQPAISPEFRTAAVHLVRDGGEGSRQYHAISPCADALRHGARQQESTGPADETLRPNAWICDADAG